MKAFEKCPICEGELAEKEVEKILCGGTNTATLKVKAEVCLHCGERLYSPKTVKRFEEIRAKLEKNAVGEFQVLGKSFRVV